MIPQQTPKRKRENTPKLTDKDSNPVETLRKTVIKLCRDIIRLDKIVTALYKPKQKLRDASSRLVLQAEQIQNMDVKKILQDLGKSSESKDLNELYEENSKLRKQIQYLEKKENVGEEYANVGVDIKCDECRKEQRKTQRRHLLTQDESYDSFKRVTENDWKDEVFPKVKSEWGPIWNAPNDYELVLPSTKTISSSNKIIKRAIDKFGGKEGLLKQNRCKGEVAMMTHSLGFPDSDGNFTQITRGILYPILLDGSANEEVEDCYTFQTMKIIKEYLIKNNKTKLAVSDIDGIAGIQLTRVIEYLFGDTEIDVIMYKTKEEKDKAMQSTTTNKEPSRTRKSSVVVDNKQIKMKKHKEDALLVSMKDKSYADLLKTLKEKVNPSEIGVDIKDIRKTRTGDVLLTVRNGSASAENLTKEIEKKVPGAKTYLKTRKKVIHLKGLEEVVTEKEISEALCKALTTKAENVDVRALRPAYGNKKNVTIVTSEVEANKLLEMETIKIGWVKCKIQERKKETKCYRCWQYGHTKEQCVGPDRQMLCLKCSKEGHRATDCKNNAYCIFCRMEGHQSGYPKCPNNSKRVDKNTNSNTPEDENSPNKS